MGARYFYQNGQEMMLKGDKLEMRSGTEMWMKSCRNIYLMLLKCILGTLWYNLWKIEDSLALWLRNFSLSDIHIQQNCQHVWAKSYVERLLSTYLPCKMMFTSALVSKYSVLRVWRWDVLNNISQCYWFTKIFIAPNTSSVSQFHGLKLQSTQMSIHNWKHK